MIPLITASLIHDAIQTESMVRAGQTYWRQGRVRELEIDHQANLIMAQVKGSRRGPYQVTILFDADPEYPVDVVCSCPVGIDCKHGAAVLFAAQDQLAGRYPTAAPAIPLPARPEPLPPPLVAWLTESQLHGPRSRGTALELAYVLAPRALYPGKKAKGRSRSERAPPVPAELSVRVWLRQGGADDQGTWSRPTPYDRAWIGKVSDPVDRWLVRRLTDHYGEMSGGVITDVGGAIWLDRAMATGRLRWQKPDGPVLAWSEAKAAALHWVHRAGGDQRLTTVDVTPEAPPEMILAACAPPLLIDAQSGAVHRLETGLDATLAERLLRLPPVPPYAVPQLAEKWGAVAGDAVPPPALENLLDRGIVAPVPVLTFREEPVDVFLPRRGPYYSTGMTKVVMAIARVSFDYLGFTVTPTTKATQIVHVTDDATIQFERDLGAEERAFAELAALGLMPLSTSADVKTKPSQAWDLALGIGAAPAHYGDILRDEVPRLRAEGWRIAYGPRWSLAFVEIEPESLRFDVVAAEEGSAIDWFDVALGARIDGKTIDILPVLRRMLGQHGTSVLDHAAEVLSLEVAPGKLAQVPMARIRPVLEMLLRFALEDRYGKEQLRLPARDLAALADFESGTSEHIPWTGAESLRSLARGLAQLELAPVKPAEGFTATLRPYQQQGLNWLQALHSAGFGGVLADDMGLGKTVQALAHVATLKAAGSLPGPVLIVCPTSVLPNWQAELAQFAPALSCLLWHGATRKTLVPQIGEHDVILTSYPLLVRDVEMLKTCKFGLVIHDEAQMLKNPKTAGFKAARQLTAGQTVALTGTPVENQLTDAWSLMELVTPGLLGTLDQFTRTIARPIVREDDGAAKALLARRLRPFMLRRTKDQVATDLPAKTEIPELIELGGAQLAQYESMRLLMQERVREEIARVGLMRSHIIFLDALLKLRQICCDPRLLAGTDGKPEPSAKLARLMEMLPELLAEGRKIILFSQFTSMLDLIKPELASQGIAFTEIRGTTKDRRGPVEAFQAGEVPLVLVSLKAGGTGLNLTAADTVILYDPWWNPAVEAQAIDRAHRIGQRKPVFVHRLIARGTIEEKILSLQDKKRSLAATLWGDGEGTGTPARLTEDDVRFLLG